MTETTDISTRFGKLLDEISNDKRKQEFLRNIPMDDIRRIFKQAPLYCLVKCLAIAKKKQEFELCIQIKKLIGEKA